MSIKEDLASIKPPENPSRRQFLTISTAAVGAAGAAAASWPFLASWKPSAKARILGAPVTVSVGDMQPGEMRRTVWRGRTIAIVRRTPEMLENLSSGRDQLRDADSENTEQQPDYAQNEYRSLKPEFLVVDMHCTHLGCLPTYQPEQGRFFCPCHLSRFDLAGRVFSGVPAPVNLRVPPYHFADDNTIVVGVDPEGVA